MRVALSRTAELKAFVERAEIPVQPATALNLLLERRAHKAKARRQRRRERRRERKRERRRRASWPCRSRPSRRRLWSVPQSPDTATWKNVLLEIAHMSPAQAAKPGDNEEDNREDNDKVRASRTVTAEPKEHHYRAGPGCAACDCPPPHEELRALASSLGAAAGSARRRKALVVRLELRRCQGCSRTCWAGAGCVSVAKVRRSEALREQQLRTWRGAAGAPPASGRDVSFWR
jgi:hypothetical protein